MRQTIKPAKGYLFCKKAEVSNVTKSGFFIPPDTIEPPETGWVINSTSDDYRDGDVVIYKPYATVDIELDKEKFFLIAIEDVLGTLHDVKDEDQAAKELEMIKEKVTKVL